jgi:hypothetical protein
LKIAKWLVSISNDYEIAYTYSGIIPMIKKINQEYLEEIITINDYCNHYKIKPIYNKITDDCIICYSSSDHQIITNCKHNYCLKCLLVWLIKDGKNECCYCLQEIDLRKSIIIINQEH